MKRADAHLWVTVVIWATAVVLLALAGYFGRV